MNFNDFVTWEVLLTFAGALGMVLVLTQLTKELPGVKKLPTQVWSYLLAVTVLYVASYFLGVLNTSSAVLILFNAAIISLAANGGFEAIKKIFAKAAGRGE